MRAVIQRVREASVSIDGAVCGSIGRGYVILLGVGLEDTSDDARVLWNKIKGLRLFESEEGKADLSLLDIQGDVLIVSQFTLYADCKKGNRPSFTHARAPQEAEALYEDFIAMARADAKRVQTGVFGAMMELSLVNHGPFTICLECEEGAIRRG